MWKSSNPWDTVKTAFEDILLTDVPSLPKSELPTSQQADFKSSSEETGIGTTE